MRFSLPSASSTLPGKGRAPPESPVPAPRETIRRSGGSTAPSRAISRDRSTASNAPSSFASKRSSIGAPCSRRARKGNRRRSSPRLVAGVSKPRRCGEEGPRRAGKLDRALEAVGGAGRDAEEPVVDVDALQGQRGRRAGVAAVGPAEVGGLAPPDAIAGGARRGRPPERGVRAERALDRQLGRRRGGRGERGQSEDVQARDLGQVGEVDALDDV